MKAINPATTHAELASLRDLVSDAASRLYMLQRAASEADSPEGRLLAVQLREIQLAMSQVEGQLGRTANCYCF